MTDQTRTDLIQAAAAARMRAYAPYSDFTVGAALLTADGTVITGCNVENRVYPAGMCAERSALFAAVSQGQRMFRAITVCGGRRAAPAVPDCLPCGQCLQALCEFCSADFEIVVALDEDVYDVYRLSDLLPRRFDGVMPPASRCSGFC